MFCNKEVPNSTFCNEFYVQDKEEIKVQLLNKACVKRTSVQLIIVIIITVIASVDGIEAKLRQGHGNYLKIRLD